ncbi:hypothetical protein A6770_15490 [Nostoc minutum NIES-26]|uniref:Uncharacterized protein n=1 Tax=Nostoc minutum NIES-26 TaxID=1844469 RepID=A0A367RME3_9NOSO|nr:hypothetical protein A6770_15490 [Nostoc minutum NIES-26]
MSDDSREIRGMRETRGRGDKERSRKEGLPPGELLLWSTLRERRDKEDKGEQEAGEAGGDITTNFCPLPPASCLLPPNS